MRQRAAHLALVIRDAVAGVPGVARQHVEVVGSISADRLNDLPKKPV
jgi:hypothetical protein